MIELSIILPAYNEEKEILSSVRTVCAQLQELKITYEIILVDDGSTDETLPMMRRCAGPQVHVFSYDKNRGKGHAVRLGMLQARGAYQLFMDVDLSTSLDAVAEFLGLMRTGEYDMLIAERKTHYGQQTLKQPWLRRFLGSGFIWLSAAVIGRGFKDFTCGFKMFTHSAAHCLFSRQCIENWAFDTELLHIAVLHGLRIKEVPVTWKHHAGSHVRPWRDIITSLQGLLRIQSYARQGKYR